MGAVAPLMLFPPVAGRSKAAQPTDLVVVQAPRVGFGKLAQRFPEGSRLVRLAPGGKSPLNLTPNFFASADPRVSFDGARLLMAAQETARAPWQIWEMNVDGSGLRQVTHCPEDCLKPAYLPRGEIVFTVVPADAASQLWVSKLDGSEAHPITFGPGDFQVETVLKNGTILATARSPLVAGEKGNPPQQEDRQLYTLRPDGSGLAAFRCDHQPAAIRSGAEELEDGSVVFLKSPAGGAGPPGELAWIRRGALHNASLATFGPPILSAEPLSDEKLLVVREVPGKPKNKSADPVILSPFACHSERSEESAGCSLRVNFAKDLQFRSQAKMQILRSAQNDSNGAQRDGIRSLHEAKVAGSKDRRDFALYIFDLAGAKFAGPIYREPGLSVVAARPVAAHEPPRWYWSTLNPALQRGYFICLDSYLAEDAGKGRLPVELAKVRVLSLGSPRPGPRSASAATERPLGEAPVEKDGSFYIAVPPDQPVRFELLDVAGRVVRAQRSWIWARSGEEHGCVGCHEDRARAPENRWPMALRRFDTPTRLDVVK